MNDNAVCLADRSAWFAGKPRSNGKLSRLLEPSLPAKNDDAVCLACRIPQLEPSLLAKNDDAVRRACRVPLWERCLPAMNDNAMGLADRGALIVGILPRPGTAITGDVGHPLNKA